MKTGDCVKWIGSTHNPEKNGKIGLVLAQLQESGRFYLIMWSDGTINGNIEKQMEAISESR